MSEDTNRANPKPPSVDRLSLLWRRVNDHKIVQWSVAYVALAYGIQHGVILTSESFEWPHAVARISMLLLALGLPVVMTLAWYHGERASRQFSKAELTIISILLVIGSLFFYVFVQPSEQIAAGPKPAVQQAGVAAARSASLNPGSAISIAVMPFANLSSDKEQEFFSDGMTDEIAGALAKVPDLRVVARSSAFEFKGQNKEARAMGQALGATHLIEGSVRQAGNRVRISAQLIQAENGLQIWSENYDRDLTDIFAIQEDIARAIATSLRMPLGLKPGETLVNNRAKDTATHEDYLRARALIRSRDFRSINQAVKLLEEAVARDPDFAPAWGLLGSSYRLIPRQDPVRVSGAAERARPTVEAYLVKAETAAQRAIKLDPNYPDGYWALGDVQKTRGKWLAAVDLYLHALTLDPDNPDILHEYSNTLAGLGYLKQALPVRERLRAMEPYVPIFSITFARYLWASGQTDAAIALFGSPAGANRLDYVLIYASQGRYGEAADLLEAIPAPDPSLKPLGEAAVRLLRTAATSAAPPRTLPQLGYLGHFYIFTGVPDRVLEYHEGNVKIGWLGADAEIAILWAPPYAPVRKTERFKAYVRAAGMVDYWRAKGWPDLCHPVGADDFVCD